MKQMFKYLALIFSVAGLAAACLPTPAEQGPENVKASYSIELNVENVSDYGCDISLKPNGPANYYGYLVVASDEVEALDSLKLYRGAYAKAGVGFELFKYASVKDTVVKFKKLQPNTNYVVYAVSSSSTGVPSKVVSAQLITTDTGNPELLNSAGEVDGAITLSFSEPVTMASGASLIVKYYASYSIPFWTNNPRPSVGSVVIGADKFTFEGNTAKTKVEGLPAGAKYSIHAGEGAFVDVKNNPCSKIAAGYFDLGNKNFQLGKIEVPDTLRTIVHDILFGFGKDGLGFFPYQGALYPGIDAVNENGAVGSLEYYFNDDGRLSYEKIKLASDNYSALDDFSKGYFTITKVPHVGDSVRVTIPEGAYIDIYGNSNDSTTVSFVYYHDLSDFIGTFEVTGRDTVSHSNIKDYIVIDRTDKKYVIVQEGGESVQKPVNLMIKYWLKTMTDPSAENIYGYWDSLNNEIIFYQGNKAFYTDASAVPYFFSTEADYVLTFEAFTGAHFYEPDAPVELYSGAGFAKVRGIDEHSFEAVRISKSTKINTATNMPADI